ncbi:MAG: UTP--glucose-1-phosphate uridylyltransferase [Ilumatobacteraceae bacterium]
MAIAHRIRTAVVPAAGSGTRMLPATKSVPKELLPILERPAIQFIVEEILGAGVEHLVIVTSRAKPAIEDYFVSSPDVEEALLRQGRAAAAEQLRRIGRELRVTFVHQDAPRGLGHAVGCARVAVAGEPFFVVLPDELMEDASLLRVMGDVFADSGRGVVALQRMPRTELGRYGIVTPVGEVRSLSGAAVVPIADIVEKPPIESAPSDLAIIGRYALTPDIFDIIDRLPAGRTGEIQLTDALSAQAASEPLSGLITEIGRWDVGNPRGWIEAVVAVGLQHPDFGADLLEWMRRTIASPILRSPGRAVE